jgi:hypothetical protein
MRRTAVTACALAASLSAGACGSGPSDQQQIKSLVSEYVAAFAAHDGGKACSLLTPEAQRRIQAAAGILRGKDCGQTLTTVSRMPTGQAAKGLSTYRAGKIVIDGNEAGVIIVPAAPGAKPTRLRKIDGKWLIDGSVAASS